MRRAIFLDRDGVINQMVYDPDHGLIDSAANPDQFKLSPGAGEAVSKINQMGLLAIVISNQPGVAKGKFSLDLLEATTQKMHRNFADANAYLDGVYYCLHHPESILPEYRQKCDCRKPKPGLLLKASQEMDIDLGKSYFIGDGIIDIIAGRAAGTTCLFVGSRKEYILDEFDRKGIEPDYIVGNLLEAVNVIFKIENREQGIESFLFSNKARNLAKARKFSNSLSS